MKFKTLSAAFAGLILSASCLVNVANAGLTEADIYGDGSNKGFTIEGSGVEWMDFGQGNINNNVSYDYVLSQLDSGEVFDGWRVATVGDMTSMVSSIWGPSSFTYGAYNANANGTGGLNATSAAGTFSALSNIIGYNVEHASGWLQTGAWFTLDGGGMANFSYGVNHPTNGDNVALANNYDYHWLTGSAQTTNSIMLLRDVASNTSPTSVPEPSTLAIFALGMMGLVTRRFKKKS